MMHEQRLHENSEFVTLTYDDVRLPKNAELRPDHFSKFIKDLRKSRPEYRIRYFGCGEYGPKTSRPHYHALLFNVGFRDHYSGSDALRPHIRRSQNLEDIWGRGYTEMGDVTMGSASYVAGYIRKKVKAARYARANPRTGELLNKEFARMSLRPAIGLNWIKENWRDVYPRDYVVTDGREAKPPRYYDKFMDFPNEKGGTPERREIMEQVRQRRCEEAIELTKYQLCAGEKITQARVELFRGRERL